MKNSDIMTDQEFLDVLKLKWSRVFNIDEKYNHTDWIIYDINNMQARELKKQWNRYRFLTSARNFRSDDWVSRHYGCCVYTCIEYTGNNTHRLGFFNQDLLDTFIEEFGHIDPVDFLDINLYANDGFEKVCDVVPDGHFSWNYKNINKDLMYDTHRSWVYVICVDCKIVKIGETGNPLGIKSLNTNQPAANSKSRLGRYRRGDGTDDYIRTELVKSVMENKVSIWAKKCPIVCNPVTFNGVEKMIDTSFHKSYELSFIDFIQENAGYQHPILNKSRK